MDGNIQVTDEFDIFVEFCFKHGGTLRNHKQFGEMARVLKQKISDMHERLLTPRAPDGALVCAQCGFPPSHHDPSCYVRRKSPRR
jgi:hypothetical protein